MSVSDCACVRDVFAFADCVHFADVFKSEQLRDVLALAAIEETHNLSVAYRLSKAEIQAIVRTPSIMTLTIRPSDLPLVAKYMPGSSIRHLSIKATYNSEGKDGFAIGLMLLLRADNLETLTFMDYTPIYDDFEPVFHMDNLRTIGLHAGHWNIDPTIFERIGTMKKLDHLDMRTSWLGSVFNRIFRNARINRITIDESRTDTQLKFTTRWPAYVAINVPNSHLLTNIRFVHNPLHTQWVEHLLDDLLGHLPGPLCDIVCGYAHVSPPTCV
jgi:hypothetical protein